MISELYVNLLPLVSSKGEKLVIKTKRDGLLFSIFRAKRSAMYTYVVLPREIRLSRQKGHADLADGESVYGAGNVRFNGIFRRKVSFISNGSGHYHPGEETIETSLSKMDANGIIARKRLTINRLFRK